MSAPGAPSHQSPEGTPDTNSSVAVTGLGIYCSIGASIPDFAEGLASGRDGVAEIGRFPTEGFLARYAALIPEPAHGQLLSRYPGVDLRGAMAMEAAAEAWTNGRLDEFPAHRLALVAGLCIGRMYDERETEDDPDPGIPVLRKRLERNCLQTQADAIARHVGIAGPVLTVSTACASAAHAFGVARGLLRHRIADAVLVGGSGEVAPEMFAGFYSLGNMSPAPCAPFSVPVGLNLGDGAAFLVLEPAPPALRRNVRVRAWFAGYGSSSDAHHATTPHPAGEGVARAVRTALADAGLAPEAVDYVNVHGTGTAENDKGEWLGLRRALGDARAAAIPISSSKSFVGHTGAAAGAIEAVITILCMENEVVPPTLHYARPRRLSPPDPVAASRPRPHTITHAVSTSSAFGGANVAVVLSRDPPSGRAPAFAGRIAVTGIGTVSAAGLNAPLDDDGTGPRLAPLPACNWAYPVPARAAFVNGVDTQARGNGRDEEYQDPVSRFMVAASRLALEQAAYPADAWLPERTAIVTGVSHIPGRSADEFQDSIRRNGLAGVASRAFSRIVMNASMGVVSESLTIKGPSCTLACGEGAGLMAAIHGCMVLHERQNTDRVLAVGADELGQVPLYLSQLSRTGLVPAEGAAALVLCRADDGGSRCRAYIDGFGVAGAGFAHRAVEQALGTFPRASVGTVLCSHDGSAETREALAVATASAFGNEENPPDRQEPSRWLGHAPATGALYCAALAARSGKGAKPGTLVLSASRAGLCCALLLCRPGS